MIDRNAIGVFEVFFHAREVIGDWFFSVLALDELGDVGHRPRAVKRVHGDEVFEGGWLQLYEVFLHASRFKLEGADGVSVAI